MNKISWYFLTAVLLSAGVACRVTGSKYQTIAEIIGAFNTAGYVGVASPYDNQNEVLGFYTLFVTPGRAVDIALFKHEDHPCLLIQFDSPAAAGRFKRDPFVRDTARYQANRNLVTQSGPFILYFDDLAHISDDLIDIFSR